MPLKKLVLESSTVGTLPQASSSEDDWEFSESEDAEEVLISNDPVPPIIGQMSIQFGISKFK